ncbi:MAG: chorismate synthase [Acidobacteriota bacterium]
MLRFHTAGESHGPALSVIVEGLPKGLPVRPDDLNRDLARRQRGYGRGGRMKLEHDEAVVLSGIRHGVTLGSPIAIQIVNRNFEQQWREVMSVWPPARPVPEIRMKRLTRPRPGHADLAGGLKYQARDLREVLERASARETAARVAAGALCKLLLREIDVAIGSHVLQLAGVGVAASTYVPWRDVVAMETREAPLRCVDRATEAAMAAEVDRAKEAGDTLGGVFEVIAHTPPPGLGSATQWDRKIDGQLAQAILSIPAVKAMEIGIGVTAAGWPGSRVHDPIAYRGKRFRRETNHAGGTEGGITNGEELRVRGYKKPISTLRNALPSVDVATKEPGPAAYERSDVTALPAAGVIGEAMVAFVLARAAVEKYGGDTLAELARAHLAHVKAVRSY